MNNENWKKGIEDLKNIKLSKEEGEILYNKVISRSPYIPKMSPYGFLIKHYTFVVSTFVIFVLLGNIVVLAENSLPGNRLYSMKINVTEPIRDLVKVNPEEKIAWQAEKATRRLEEAESLAVQNKLDDKKRDEIENLFEKSVSNFDDRINKLATSSENKKVREIESELNRRVSAHSKVLEKVEENKEQEKIKKEEVKKEIKNKDKEREKIDIEKDIEKEEEKKIERIVENRLKELEKLREKLEKEREKTGRDRDRR